MQTELRRPSKATRPRAAGWPRVTIGLPVFNGERHLEAALGSLLAQTFRDFELVISDNASTDRTAQICLTHAARDPRIRYSRLETNIGGFRNHNRVVSLARGDYFTWAGDDDVRAPEHLARCVEALDRDPGIVLSFTLEHLIGEADEPLPGKAFEARVGSADAACRWGDMVFGGWVYDPHYGVARTDILRRTGLLAEHADSDRILLAELALHGRMHRVAEPLLTRRIHSRTSHRQDPSSREYTAWYAPMVLPARGSRFHLTMLRGYLASLYRAHPRLDVLASCHADMFRWIRMHQYALRHELGWTRAQIRREAAGWLGMAPREVR